MLSNLKSNPNLVKILLISVFFVDCLICLNISLIALKILKSSLSGSILINLQLNLNYLQLLSFYFVVNIPVTVSVSINFY